MPELPAADSPSEARPGRLRAARAIAGALVLSALVLYGTRYASELHRLLRADPRSLAGVAGLVVVVRLLAAEIMRDTLARLGHALPRLQIFWLSALSSVSSLLVPRAGFGAFGLALRMRHGVPFAASSSLLLPLSVLDLIVVGVAGLGVQAWLAAAERPASPLLTLVFAATLVAALGALFVGPRLPFAPARLAQFLARVADAWQRLRGDRGYALGMLGLLTAITGLRVARLALAFHAIGFAPRLEGLVLASLLGDLTFMLALTPGALGLREAAIVYGAQLSGVTPEAALAAAVIDRIAMIGVLLVLAQIAAFRALRTERTS